MISEPTHSATGAARGHVWLLADGPREPELVFDFPFDDELNDAIRRLPGRWFNWRHKHWRVPADPRLARAVEAVLARFPGLVPNPDVVAWLGDADRWRAVVTVAPHGGSGAFVVRTLSGELPSALGMAGRVEQGRLVLPFSAENARRLSRLEGAQLHDLARECARKLEAGGAPAPAELALDVGDDGEPELTLYTLWDPTPARDFGRLPEARLVERGGRYFDRAAAWAVAVPADPALAIELTRCAQAHPHLAMEPRVEALLEELRSEHERARATVALSYAEDADLDGLVLGGELYPFQRAGVRYALERRRTFIADEQGLGKTIQALATLESDRAFPAVVVCPASMKLTWEREAARWLSHRTVSVLDGRTDAAWRDGSRTADILILNYDILEAHYEALAERDPKALVLDESHYVKNPGARRTKSAVALARRLSPDALRLGLTGTPVLNRPEELVSQLRALGRLDEFGSGARLSRRFRDAGSDDRLHWNLRARCYVRRTKQQVLPQLPAKRHDAVPVALVNDHEYRLAERDVIAWLQTLPLDLRTMDAKVAAALRAEQLVRLNSLRQLAARGKLPAALAWIEDFLASGEPLVVFAEHVATQRAVLDRFPEAVHILGADSSRERQAAVDAFQRGDGPPLIVCSLRAGSQGVTLTRASNVAFLELDWTPARHDQAEDRLHRIGQATAVTAYYLLAPDTIDETMAELLERKRALIDAVTDGQVRDEERMVDAVVRELRERPVRHLRVVA